MIKHVLFFFTFLIANLTTGQVREANLILKDGKKVEGFGEIKKDKIYFRLTQEENPDEWTQADAQGIEFTGYKLPEKYIFITHGKKKEIHLMEALQQGTIELYKDTYFTTEYSATLSPGMTRVDSVKNMEYYIKKPNDEIGIKVDMDFKKIGQAFFSDCEDLMANINEEEFFEVEEIIDLVKFYNRNCSK